MKELTGLQNQLTCFGPLIFFECTPNFSSYDQKMIMALYLQNILQAQNYFKNQQAP